MRALLALLPLALVAGCSTPDATPGASPEESASSAPSTDVPTASTDAERAPVPYEFRTAITDAGFAHPRLDAATQATLVWTNDGSQTHSIVSKDGTFAGSGPLSPGMEFRWTLLAPGDFEYLCRYHPEMTGLVVVR